MQHTIETSGDVQTTGRMMHEMVRRYHHDMAPWYHLSLWEVFDLIKSLPFRPDPDHEETLMRPELTMTGQGYGGDCDDKCIALASYCFGVGIPYRFVAVRRPDRKELHHVICDVYISGKWVHADPTYSFNTLGRQRETYTGHTVI